MSRAFVKETEGGAPLPDRPISPHRNLVTGRGLKLIEEAVARYQGELARATAAADREAIGRAARELRYWTARLATAEVSDPDPGIERVVFGTAVTVGRGDGSETTIRSSAKTRRIRPRAGSPGPRPWPRRCSAASPATSASSGQARSRF